MQGQGPGWQRQLWQMLASRDIGQYDLVVIAVSDTEDDKIGSASQNAGTSATACC